MSLRHLRREETVGRGADAFARCRERLLAYTFYPPRIVTAPGPVREGATLHQRIRVGPLRFRGPVKVLALWDEPDRVGYRYEALPGHVERGVAEFELRVTAEGDVRFRIESHSAPAHPLARAFAPLARALQRRAYAGAFKSMREAAGERPR